MASNGRGMPDGTRSKYSKSWIRTLEWERLGLVIGGFNLGVSDQPEALVGHRCDHDVVLEVGLAQKVAGEVAHWIGRAPSGHVPVKGLAVRRGYSEICRPKVTNNAGI